MLIIQALAVCPLNMMQWCFKVNPAPFRDFKNAHLHVKTTNAVFILLCDIINSDLKFECIVFMPNLPELLLSMNQTRCSSAVSLFLIQQGKHWDLHIQLSTASVHWGFHLFNRVHYPASLYKHFRIIAENELSDQHKIHDAYSFSFLLCNLHKHGF